MSRKYRKRITEFLKDMADGPVSVVDFYKMNELQRKKMTKSNMDNDAANSTNMIFRAPRTDEDIRNDMRVANKYLDTDPPTVEQVKAWNMRPREKH